MTRPRLLMVVNSDWFFLSHRLPIAHAARAAGYDVTIATIDTGEAQRICDEGFRFEPLRLTHCGLNPFAELGSVLSFVRLYRRLRPDIVHHVTVKPVLYGSIAARLVGGIAVVNAVPGLGHIFSANSAGARLLRPLVSALYRVALRGTHVRAIFQNPEDRAAFVDSRAIEAGRTVLIRGSGVDLNAFSPRPGPAGPPTVVLPSRMIRAKGIGEFVAAARIVRASMPQIRFVLVGKPDPGNPTAVPVAQLQAWHDEGVVEWWGHRTDMPDILAMASIVALPTFYREGVPRVLIEAAAAGRPIVTTDMPGCREIVHDDVNGRLVPPRDVGALAAALLDLLRSPGTRARYGAAGRRLATGDFSIDAVVARTLAVYEDVRGAGRRRTHAVLAPSPATHAEAAT